MEKDILERVQNNATRLYVEMKGLTSENRISFIGVFSLERMYKRGDLMQAYKIINGIEVVKGMKLS